MTDIFMILALNILPFGPSFGESVLVGVNAYSEWVFSDVGFLVGGARFYRYRLDRLWILIYRIFHIRKRQKFTGIFFTCSNMTST